MTAKTILERIDAALEQGGWASNERTKLGKLSKAWTERAYGRDARFNRFGWSAKGGREPGESRSKGAMLTTAEELRRIIEESRRAAK